MGSLLRLALFILCVWLVLRAVRQMLLPASRPTGRRTLTADVVPCAACGTYVPESEAVTVQGEHFCCEEHAQSK